MHPLRLAFMGTPAFAIPALAALSASPHEIVAIYTQPPRPAGRGQKIQKSPVHEFAEALGIPVLHPVSLKQEEEKQTFAALDLDAAIVAAYGLILPKAVLTAPRHGCLNIHGSLLPRWRGAAPIQRALLAGNDETGITIMQMEAGLDTGPMLLKEAVPITDDSTAVTLHDQLAEIGARLILPALEGVISGVLVPVRQSEDEATYAAKLSREDGRLDWSQPAPILYRQIRALMPWPGTWFEWKGEMIKVANAEIVISRERCDRGISIEIPRFTRNDNDFIPPGTLLDADMTIACGEGALRLTKLQRPGKSWQEGRVFLRGTTLTVGDALQ